ncbi:MAG: carbohydrate porin [Cyanobacteria bacterium CRU_2_1]|nr:carbohydrate porin [Cyanobacteria bacterium CRU_2_1]
MTRVTPVHQLEVQSISDPFTIDQNQLQNDVDALETRVSDLEAQQFSPTAALTGEVVWEISGVSGSDLEDSVVFQGSVELILTISFTGEDTLEVGVESGNAIEFSFVDELTFEGRLDFPSGTDNGLFELSELSYEFPYWRSG